jgi:hypothetical protein
MKKPVNTSPAVEISAEGIVRGKGREDGVATRTNESCKLLSENNHFCCTELAQRKDFYLFLLSAE